MIPIWLGVLAQEAPKSVGTDSALDWVKAVGPFAVVAIALVGMVYKVIRVVAQNAGMKVIIEGQNAYITRLESAALPDLLGRKIELLEKDKAAVDATVATLKERQEKAETEREAAKAEAKAAKAEKAKAITEERRKVEDLSQKLAKAIEANKRVAESSDTRDAKRASMNLGQALHALELSQTSLSGVTPEMLGNTSGTYVYTGDFGATAFSDRLMDSLKKKKRKS